MKTKILLPLLLILISISGFSKTWTVSNFGSQFSPATITINPGDSVNFTITSSHDAVEVSQSTWDANGKTPLPGFSLPFGGGLVLPSQLSVGTHYYVCTPHAAWGMKGTIIVQNITGNAAIEKKADLAIYPNPSKGIFQVAINDMNSLKNGLLDIYNVKGEKVYSIPFLNTPVNVDLSNSSNGVYFLKFFDGEGFITKKIVKQ